MPSINRPNFAFSLLSRATARSVIRTILAVGTVAVLLAVAHLFSARSRASGVVSMTFIVTNVADSGAGSLRQAILDANSNPGTDSVAFNIPGSGVQTILPTTALPTIIDPVIVDGYTQPGATPNTLVDGDNAVLLIELSGSSIAGQASASGIQIAASNCIVRGLVINRFGFGDGIFIATGGPMTTGNLIEGNFLGTNPAGTAALGNNHGIEIQFSNNNQIGGTTPASRNLISGNFSRGVFLSTSSSVTTIQGNYLGTNASGTAALGNISGGIFAGGLGNDVIGGVTAGARNVISGNQNNAGIFVQYGNSSSVTIQGNFIGTDVTGTVAVPNFFGIWINHGPSNAATNIGGTAAGARNLISGNQSDGLFVSQSTRNSQILGNLIGTDLSGTKPLGNSGNGIEIDAFAVNNKVGGNAAGQGNTIAFNARRGVFVTASFNATGNAIRRNSIFSNGDLGIDLAGDGVTANDPGDSDIGPNNFQNFPLITSVTGDASQTTITGTLNSTPSTTFSVNLYVSSACDPSGNGEGTTPFGLGTVPVTTDANGNGSFGVAISIPLSSGQTITATATDPAGNTSEFSPCDSSKTTGSVQFSVASLKAIEDVGFVTINALRVGGSKGTLSVDYTTADITATAGQDYLPVSGTLTFNEGETSKSFDITILDDATNEADESFVVRLQNAPNIDSLGTPSAEVITLQDHSIPPQLSINSLSVAEGDSGTSNAVFTVTLAPLTGRSVMVDYQTVSGTAASDLDFQPVSGTLSFGARQVTRTISVPIIGDMTDEFSESFQVQLANPTNATLAPGGSTGTGTILDNDPPPLASISDTVVVEGNSSITFARFSVTLSQISGKPTCVQASTSDGTATASSGDYAQIGGSITNPPTFFSFNPGSTGGTFTVQVRGDAQFEPNETFFANIVTCNADTVLGRGQAVGTIINDDPQVPPSISISDVAVSDGSGSTNAVFDVALSAASTQTVTVQYATAAGTASAGSDFQSVSGTLTFDPGITQQPVTVPVVGDSASEGNETFTLNLSNPVGGTLADTQGLCTISDGAPSQLPYLTINDVTVVEGASGTSDVDFTVTLSQATDQQVFFQYSAAPGTASENVDYLNVFGGALIAPGGRSFKISVPIVGDQIAESDETFFINISNATGATIADNQGVGTILNYVTPSIQLSGGIFVSENIGSATMTITRSGNSLTTSTVDVATADGSASQRTDYTISASHLTFLPGETSKFLDVPIVNDVYVEGDESFTINLSNPSGAVLGGPSSSLVTVTDDDASPPATNPLDNADARFFVREHYYDFLSRVPDQSGFDFWSGQITQCGSDQACLRTKRVDVSNAFFYELEFQQTGAYVYRLYRSAFGNNQPFPNPIPDPNSPGEEKKLLSYQVFANDRARVVGGASLAQAQQDLANAFVLRAEFLAKYPASLDGPGFVDAVLATIKNDLGVDLTTRRQSLIDLFFQAGNADAGRGAIMYRLADDNIQTNPINNRAFIDAEYNRAFVATQYFGYLRRDPDMAGFLFWLGQVNGAPLRDVARQHAMVCSFITSAEYQQRFSPVVTHFNSECQ